MKYAFNKENPSKNEWGKMYASAKQLWEAKVLPEEVPTLVKNMIITYGEKYTTVNSICSHTELKHGAKTRSSKDVEEILETKNLEKWAKEQ